MADFDLTEAGTEPERTPESLERLQKNSEDLWQKTELALQEERAAAKATKVDSSLRNYKGVGKTWSSGSNSSSSRPARAFGLSTARNTSQDKSPDDLWHKEEMELQRLRAAAAQRGKGLRIYDISGRKGMSAKGFGDRFAFERRVYPSKSAESSFKDSLQKDGRFFKIILSRRSMDDRILTHWCRWAQPHLDRLPNKAVVSMVDLSFNQISAEGVRTLLQTLRDADVPVEGFNFHQNCLNDAAACDLAQYIQHSSYTLYELHLTHNQISELGARSLLESAVKALQSPVELVSGRPTVRYPCQRNGRQVPLWLRLGQNRIGDGRGSAWVRNFLQSMEHELLPARRTLCQSVSEDPWGHLDALTDAQLFCEALSAYGCDRSSCTQTYPEISGLPPGPVVHLPMLDQQLSEHPKGSSFKGNCKGGSSLKGSSNPKGGNLKGGNFKGGFKGGGFKGGGFKGSSPKGCKDDAWSAWKGLRNSDSQAPQARRQETVDLLDLEIDAETSQSSELLNRADDPGGLIMLFCCEGVLIRVLVS